jgi:hypothetical protein
MGLLQDRMNEHAHDCEVAYRLLALSPSSAGPLAAFKVRVRDVEWDGLVAEGKLLAAALRAGGDPPSLDELRWWHRRARVCIQALKETDPAAVLSYVSDLKSEKDQRLIRGM